MRYYVRWYNREATAYVQTFFKSDREREALINRIPGGVVIQTWETVVVRPTRRMRGV